MLSIHRDRARGRHSTEEDLLSAPREDQRERLHAKLVEVVRGERLRDDLHLVDAACRVSSDDLLDVVHAFEGRLFAILASVRGGSVHARGIRSSRVSGGR